VIKTLGKVLTHPVTMVNFSLFGMLLVIQVVHTKAHLTLETDVHGHAYRVLKKNPELATSSCYKMGFSKQ
jgi:hypothetical protein